MNIKLITNTVLQYSLLVIILTGCKNQNSHDERLLSEPLSYKNDTLKLNAYKFLINNMQGLKHVDNDKIVRDINVIDQKYLVNNIDEAFESSKSLLDNKLITVQDFYEYVLPYRLNFAKVESWREAVWMNAKKTKIENVKSEDDLSDSCNIINDGIKKWYKFGSINELEDTLNYGQMSFHKKGTCVGMANVAAFTMRALGLPIAIDHALWGNMDGGHRWNALITRNGSLKPFLGAESNISSENKFYVFNVKTNPLLSTFKKPGKVYRNTFSVQKESFAYQVGRSNVIPPELSETREKDVTKEYLPVEDITVKARGTSGDPKYLLICNFNSGAWVPVMGTLLKSKEYTFRNMARDMLYNTFTYSNERNVKPFNFPIYIDAKGAVCILNPDKEKSINLEINRTQSIVNDQIVVSGIKWDDDKLTDLAYGKTFTKPINGRHYTLYVWDGTWKVAGNTMSIDDKVKFANIPSNGLYLLSGQKRNLEDRPFIMYHNKIKWL